jgi:hypothetical protein
LTYGKYHYDEQTAFAEGWCLSERDDGFWEIQRLDECEARSSSLDGDGLPPFITDAEALAYVRRMAIAGSRLHAEAMRLNGRRWNT